MSIDGFAAFQEIGLSATAAIDKEGLRYRDTVLSMGGARAPGLVFQVSKDDQCDPSLHDGMRHAHLFQAGCHRWYMCRTSGEGRP